MKQAAALLSMLHEPAGDGDSARRLFRDQPVLAWTLRRLSAAKSVSAVAILCWDDQQPAVHEIAAEFSAYVAVHAPRASVPQLDAIAAARRWADGWRGGLMAACEFDRGFFAPFALQVQKQLSAEGILLVDPAAGLIDPQLIDSLMTHAEAQADLDMVFSQAAPGLSAVWLRGKFVEELAAAKSHPGVILSYRPDQPRRDPVASEACAPIPAPLARTGHRFTLDSSRQIQKLAQATTHLNGQLISSRAEELLAAVSSLPATVLSGKLPRDITLELNTRRASSPIFWPGKFLDIQRQPMGLEILKSLCQQLADLDDVRITLAGVGDPLLADHCFDLIESAASHGIPLSLETDFLGVEPAVIDRLAQSRVDVVSVHLPAVSAVTYEAVMGVDGYKTAMENISRFLTTRARLGRGTPILVPTFVKCRQNLAEMEAWYDHWLRLLNCAVIVGPSEFAGQIPDCGVADMAPPRRIPCRRLDSRLTILCDGRIASCEQDALGLQSLGNLGENSLSQIWSDQFAAMRTDHQCGQWDKHPLCGSCRQWHRP